MKKNTYNLLIELSGQKYRDLLDYALSECKYFLLVTSREKKQLSSRGKAVLEELAPYLYRMDMQSEWPGTVLLTIKVPVYIYHFIPESAEILKRSGDRLYQWQEPDLPDDLCILRSDESPWLITTAHENDSYFILSEEEMLRLLKALPDFASVIELAKE